MKQQAGANAAPATIVARQTPMMPVARAYRPNQISPAIATGTIMERGRGMTDFRRRWLS